MSASNASRRSLSSSRRRAAPLPVVGVAVAGVLATALFTSSEASAERVALLGFEGTSAVALRWRVAAALKREGHTVIGVRTPRTTNPAELRAYARRRRVDVFISGASSGSRDGWELALTLRDAEGEEVGNDVTLSTSSLRGMLNELKADGQSRIDSAVRGGSAVAGSGVDADADADADAGNFARKERARAKKRGRAARARRAEEAVELDADADAASSDDGEASSTSFDADADTDTAADTDEGARPRTAEASGWSASDDDAGSSDTTAEDDGRASFLSDDAAGDGAEVGADDEGEASDEGASATDDPTVVLRLNAGFLRRTLSYSDDLYGRLRAPSANSWVYRLQAAVYPFARPVKNRIGLIAGYESEFSGVVRDNEAGTDFGVTFSEVYGGLKLRQPLGVHELALEGTVGSMQAGLDDPNGASGVPGISYTSLRAALDLGLNFGRLSMRGAFGYRLPIGSFGEASEVRWFPRMEASGIEGSLGLEYRITREVAFDLSGTMRRYLLQMNSQPEDARLGTSEVAGGAVDLYLGGYFGLNIKL